MLPGAVLLVGLASTLLGGRVRLLGLAMLSFGDARELKTPPSGQCSCGQARAVMELVQRSNSAIVGNVDLLQPFPVCERALSWCWTLLEPRGQGSGSGDCMF